MFGFSAISDPKWRHYFGVSGISAKESRSIRLWGHFVGYIYLLLAIAILALWQLLLDHHLVLANVAYYHVCVLAALIGLYCSCLFSCRLKKRFMQQNWMLPLVSVCYAGLIMDHSLPMYHYLAPLISLILMLYSIQTLWGFLFDGSLRTTLVTAAVTVITFGLLAAGIDPAIDSLQDGIWWAIATVSTVGYGDVVPGSLLGRMLGALLVMMGFILFAVITKNILAMVIKKESARGQAQRDQLDHVFSDIKQIKKQQQEILDTLQKLNKKKS